jgi:NADH dehydrogenase
VFYGGVRVNIVIVGGGAGGLELVIALGRLYKRRKDITVTLVDQSLAHVWKPLLHEVASGSLNNIYDKMSYLALAKKNHFHFELGQLKTIDRTNRTLLIRNPVITNEPCELVLSYDLLVLAIGSVTNNFATPGSDEFCYYLNFEYQARHLNKVLFEQLIYNHYGKNVNPIQIAIIGGGATGVELAAELRTSLSQLSALISQKLVQKKIATISIIEAGPRILPLLPDTISSLTQTQLHTMGIDVLTNRKVTEIQKEGIKTADDQFIPADLMIWAAGIKGQDEVKTFCDFELNSIEQIKVKPTLQTTVDDAIFAMGDCASCIMPDGKPVPARAQAAHQQANLLVKSIQHVLKQKTLQAYQYVDHGSLVSLSHNRTLDALFVGNKENFLIKGYFARMIYLSLYTMHQIKIIGYWKVAVMTFANFLVRRVRSSLKLH